MARYTQHVAQTPQSEPLDERQVKNSAGGYSFPVDDWVRLDRFLILGSEGGSYYAGERKLTRENAQAVLRCATADPKRTVDRIVEISTGGRAPKNDPAVFALALCAAHEKAAPMALDAMPQVCRIGTHLFQFVDSVQQFRGWGRGLRRNVSRWYGMKDAPTLALQVSKYRQRGGWSHRDVLRLCHFRSGAGNPAHDAAVRWAVRGDLNENSPLLLAAFSRAQSAKSAKELLPLIEQGLTWEMIPTELLGNPDVWRMLMPKLPMTALLRNLARMTASGALQAMSVESKLVSERLVDQEALRKARVHPIAVLAAALTYASGHGARGSLIWNPVGTINDALDAAFYASFGNVTPTGKRLRVALDVSGSMTGGQVAGVPGLSPRVASAAMAMVWAKTEPNVEFMAFCDRLVPFDMSKRRSIAGVCQAMNQLSFGGTDCSLPVLDADKSHVDRDAFLVLTDAETWSGSIHPSAALKSYRRHRELPAKLVVVGMVSNGFSIADPNDGGMLDVVGFDTVTPQLVSDFVTQ